MAEGLSPRETRALESYRARGGFPLSPEPAAKLFTLFLQGFSTEELQAQNPSYDLGMIVRARLDYGWDERRAAYLEELHAGIRERVATAQLEAIKFGCAALQAYHRLQGGKFNRFLQTGNPEDLGEWAGMHYKDYANFVGLVMRLTGQDLAKEPPPPAPPAPAPEVIEAHVLPAEPETPETALEAILKP